MYTPSVTAKFNEHNLAVVSIINLKCIISQEYEEKRMFFLKAIVIESKGIINEYLIVRNNAHKITSKGCCSCEL